MACSAMLLIIAVFLIWKLCARSEWDHYQQELTARGEYLDWRHFTPPPLDDAANFYAAPGIKALFQRGPYSSSWGPRQPLATTAWRLPEERADWKDLQGHDIFVKSPYHTNYPVSVALQWEEENGELIEQFFNAAKRKHSRVLTDYQTPFNHDIANSITFRTAAQTMSTLAQAYIAMEKPEQASRYMEGIRRIMRCYENGPTLIDAMMRVAIAGLYVEVVEVGLEREVWDKDQLRAISLDLSRMKLLPRLAAALREERARTLEITSTKPFREFYPSFKMSQVFAPSTKNASPVLAKVHFILDYLMETFHGLRFGSAREKNLLHYSRLFQELLDSVDAAREQIYPRRFTTHTAKLQIAQGSGKAEHILVSAAHPDFTKALQMTARNQTLINQASVACALESFRQTHGSYPSTFQELSPVYLAQLPHDLIGGGPLQYQRPTPETFLLYSIGWDEVDDKGVGTNDWVWGTKR